MKRVYLASLGLMLAMGSAWAKPPLAPVEFGMVRAVSANTVVDLEMQRPDLVRQPDFRGYSREFLKLPLGRSTSRFLQGTPLAWTVCNRSPVPDRCGVNWITLHPSGFELHPLKVENTTRVLMLVEANPYQETEHSGLPLKVSQTDPDTLRLECGAALAPGEYALVYQPRDGGATAYCFGIDAVAP